MCIIVTIPRKCTLLTSSLILLVIDSVFLNHETSGSGIPEQSHGMLRLPPSITVKFLLPIRNSGGSEMYLVIV